MKRKADDVIQHIVSSSVFTATDLRAFRRNLLDRKSACSIQALNGFVHGPYDLPTADALLAGWDQWCPCSLRRTARFDGRGCNRIGPSGRYSPLRYPGGKGKFSKFMAAIVRKNGLSDGDTLSPMRVAQVSRGNF